MRVTGGWVSQLSLKFAVKVYFIAVARLSKGPRRSELRANHQLQGNK